VTVVTGSDAVALAPRQTKDYPGQADVSVIYTDIENPNPAAVSHQATLAFTKSDAGTASLADPWTIATYNAMTAAGSAISGVTGSSETVPPLMAVWGLIRDLTRRFEVAGATGGFSFTPGGDVAGQSIPIIELRNGSAHTLPS
jgi:ABC-type branched-subunit amino acid transport system substrate-binding protein